MVVAALAAAAVGAPLEGAVLLALFSLSRCWSIAPWAGPPRGRGADALRPETAFREGQTGVRELPVADLVPGDRVILRPGARVPVDGRVVEGEGSSGRIHGHRRIGMPVARPRRGRCTRPR
jgi:Cd2+/Zn2+-exporting ATPase